MRTRLGLAVLLLLVGRLAWAAPAKDAVSCSSQGTGTLSWTHTPAGTPRGVIVYVMDTSNGDSIIAVPTYGGVGLVQTANSPQIAGGVNGAVHSFFLGSAIPTGAQTVEVTEDSGTNKIACAVTFTASGNTEVIGTAIVRSSSQANPSTTLALSGRTSVVVEGVHSGVDAVGSITPSTGWTGDNENDFGTFTSALYTYNTVASSNVTVGYTAAADEATLIAIAVAEVVVPASSGLTTLGAG